jgi:hypothetical protein
MNPKHAERRSFPRPPLWLNLLLLIIAAATFAFAKVQRDMLDREMTRLFKAAPSSSPTELNRIRDELSQMDLTKSQLAQELDARLQFAQMQNSEQFYIAIDTARRKFSFRLGNDVVREADVVLGDAKTIKSRSGKTWTFVPLKGAFTVAGKETDYEWSYPEWLYAMNNLPAPDDRPAVANGLGKYVIVLQDNYIIHSPPPDASPLRGTAKPGSIMVPEEELAAIWPRINNQTRVYIF